METVREHCKHVDCVYRGRFNFEPACEYILLEGKPRGCSISKCNKYKIGIRKRINNMWYVSTEVEDDI